MNAIPALPAPVERSDRASDCPFPPSLDEATHFNGLTSAVCAPVLWRTSKAEQSGYIGLDGCLSNVLASNF